MNNTGLMILALYTLSLFGIAFYASRQDKKNIKDFATAGSSLGVFVLTLTFSATYHSSYAFLGAGGFIYNNGIGWWVNGIWTVFPGCYSGLSAEDSGILERPEDTCPCPSTSAMCTRTVQSVS